MAGEEMSMWEMIDSYRVLVKEQIASGVAAINEYAGYFKTQAGYYVEQTRAVIANAIAQMGGGFTYAYNLAKYYISHFPEMAMQALTTVTTWLQQGFIKGYQYCVTLLKALKNFITALPDFLANFAKVLWNRFVQGVKLGVRFIRALGNLIYEALSYIPELLAKIYKNGVKILVELKDVLILAAKNIWQAILRIPHYLNQLYQVAKTLFIEGFKLALRVLRSLGRELYKFLSAIPEMIAKIVNNVINVLRLFKDGLVQLAKNIQQFIMNIPHYLNQLWKLGKELVLAVKDLAVTLINNAIPVIKAIWNELSKVVSHIATKLFDFAQWAVKGLAKRVFMGLGIVYGISSVLVETLAGGVNALTMKTLGLNLANYAAFATIQTGLSVVLAAAAVYMAVRFSYLAIAGIYSASFLNRQRPQGQVQEVQEDDRPRVQPEMPLNPPVIARQFDNQRRAANEERNDQQGLDQRPSHPQFSVGF